MFDRRKLFTGALGLGLMSIGGPASAASSSGSSNAKSAKVAASKISGIKADEFLRVYDVTATEWRAFAAAARSTGHAKDAKAMEGFARTLPKKVHGTSSAELEPMHIVGSVAKKALVLALRHGSKKLPKKIRPYGPKIAAALDDVTAWQQSGIVFALSHAGIPADVVGPAAEWIVFFLGL